MNHVKTLKQLLEQIIALPEKYHEQVAHTAHLHERVELAKFSRSALERELARRMYVEGRKPLQQHDAHVIQLKKREGG